VFWGNGVPKRLRFWVKSLRRKCGDATPFQSTSVRAVAGIERELLHTAENLEMRSRPQSNIGLGDRAVLN
jgi:hypothetical protein